MATSRPPLPGRGYRKARDLASLGWPVFFLTPGLKTPISGTHGHLDATTLPEEVLRIYVSGRQRLNVPDLGVGVRCSGPAGFTVDLDVKNGKDGIAEFSKLVRAAGADWPETLQFRTRSGGMHLVFRSPTREVHTGSDVLGPGIDLRGPRGYRAVYDPSDPDAYQLDGVRVAPQLAPTWLLADERLYGPTRSAGSEDVELPEGDMCPAVARSAHPRQWDLTDHHSTARRVTHLVLLGQEGHTGVVEALAALRPLYVLGRNWKTEQDGQPRDPESDFDRMVEGALSKGTGRAVGSDPCKRLATITERLGL